MEGFLDALGTVLLIVMVVIGALAGFIAGKVAGRRTGLYVILGMVGAVALPFILAALGIGVLAAGGAVAIIVAALVGAAVLLVLGKLIFD